MIQAEATTPIPTGVVFWSHDKGTAKLIIQLKKDHINQTLPQGTIVPILLEFNSDTAAKGKGRHIYHAVIENALEGIVSIVLEDNILGYVGRVDGSVYIELPDSRSLDTAGRFTFDIKRSPIDEDVPELEDYYWQGFNEIMNQYHQTIATIKSEAKTLLDSLTADVTTAQSKVAQLEQSITTANTNLNARIDEINKKIDDNDVFTKAESSANVIYQLVGKEKVKVIIPIDLKGKIANSTVENPNSYSWGVVTTLAKPSDLTLAPAQVNYNRVMALDSVSQNILQNANGKLTQACFFWNVLEVLKRELGEKFFTSRGAMDLASQVEITRNETTVQWNVWGNGSSPNGFSLTVAGWAAHTGVWSGQSVSTTASITKISNKTSTSNNKYFIDDNGFVNIAAYAEAADGVTNSVVNIDYANLEVTLEISMNEFIESMIAHNHIENLAAQEEAEAGEDNTKTMTPLRVFQSIAKWTKDKFVSMTENETVLGIKNFANGLQVNGRNVLSQKGEIVFDHTSETDSSIQSGIVRFKRYGDWILVNFNFQCRSTDIASGGNLIDSLEADIVPSGSIQVDVTFDKALTIDASGKVTALWGLEANKYYTGSAMYFAKNKL